MPHIFISYRRSEAAYAAHAIYNHLRSQYGEDSVVFDVDSIPLGADFVEYLDSEVSRCDVLLPIIGDDWIHVQAEGGGRRIDDPDDYVVTEIQAALDRNIHVIPVLVEGAAMPKAEELPQSIRSLSRRNAVEVGPGRDFQQGLATLERGLEKLFERLKNDNAHEGEQANIVRNWIASLAALIAAGVAGSLLLSAVSIPYNNAAIAFIPMANTGLLNICMYSLAIIAGVYASRGIWLTMGRYDPGEKIDDYDARQFTYSALGLPFHIPLLVLLLWVGSGIIIPAFLRITKPAEEVSILQVLQFLSVQTLLGAMAAAITYFLLAAIIIGYIYPAFATRSVVDAHRQLDLLEKLAPVATAILYGLPAPTFLAMTTTAYFFGMQAKNEWQMWFLSVPFMVLATCVSTYLAIRLSSLRKRLAQLERQCGA